MMGFAGTAWLLVVLALVLGGVAIALAVWAGSRRDSDASDRAHDILRQRLATGEIDEAEYRERAQAIGPPRAPRSATGRWLPAAVVALVAVVVLVLAAVVASGSGMAGGGWWGPMGGHMDGHMGQRSADGSAPAAIPDAADVTVEAGEMWFEPPTFEVVAGEAFNLTVDNRGEVFHDLTIDALDLQIDVDAGQSTTAGLEITTTGEYEFYCSVPGHRSAGMQGTVTVVEASN